MADVYRIGISIALTNGVSGVLKVIAKDVFGLGQAVDNVSNKFNRMNAMIEGAVAVAGGLAAVKVFKSLADAGGIIVDQQQKLYMLGLSNKEVAEATVVAYQKLSVAGTTPGGNLAHIGVLRNVLGSLPDAYKGLDSYNKAAFVLKSAGYDPGQLDYFLKALDVQGAFVKNGKLDPAAFGAALQESIASVLTSGGLLNGQAFYQASRLSNPAGQAMGTETYLKNMTEVLVALGNRGARGLEYGATDFIGGTMSKAQIRMLEKMHLLAPRDVTNTGGGRYLANTSHLVGADMLAKGDIIGWLHTYFNPAAQKAGLDPLQAGAPFQQTLQSLMSFIATNWPQIARSQEQQAQAQKADQYGAAKGSKTGATEDLATAEAGFWQVLGVPEAKMLIPILNGLSNAIRTATQIVGAHPNAAKDFAYMLGGLAVGLTALGATAILVGMASMVGPAGLIFALATGITAIAAAFAAVNWAEVTTEFRNAIDLIAHPFSDNPLNHQHDGQHYVHSGRFGGYWAPNTTPGSAPGSPGKPLHVHVTNSGEVGGAAAGGAAQHITRQLTAPNSGPSGFNGQASPPGSAASSNPQ